MRFHCLLILALCFSTLAVSDINAQSKRAARPTSFWPQGVKFDRSVPTPKQHFGFEVGFRHLSHAQVASYAHAVAAASDRVTIEQTGQTHGGRPLLLLMITSKKNRARQSDIQKDHYQLASGNSDRVDIENLPAVINMGYGVHGDEPSATNSAPLVMHYLAAAQGKEIERWLDDCIILIDPSINPDGFNRFANWANRYRGRVLNPDPQHAEHSQQWPPGRVNYYWFDLNRDWLPLVHPESQARMKWYHAWKPNVVLDFHEMGTNSTFFFQPGIPERTNPLTPARNVELTGKFANYHARALDKRGSLYFTQERFDDFYMGKGSTYPDLHGSIGILFEQASSRGHVQKNQDGLLRFHDTIANQFTTSLSSLRATVDLRTELHEHKRTFYNEALKMAAASPKQTFVFSCPDNRTRLQAFADILIQHDIKCYWLSEDLEYGDDYLNANTDLIVPVNQPEYRFLKSLLMRRKTFRENIFYDVSSWTLSLAYGLNQRSLARSIDPELLTECTINQKTSNSIKFEKDDVAYLVDWRDDQAVPFLNRLLRNNIKVRAATKAFTIKDGAHTEFPQGTLSIPLGVQPKKRETIRKLIHSAAKNGLAITPVKTGLTPVGIDLGSGNFPVIKKKRVAMLTGRSISPYGAGEIWHHLDTRVGMPLTMIKPDQFASADLSEYTTLILPSGRYSGMSEAAIKNIREWVNKGGNLIAIGGSCASVATTICGLTDVAFVEDEKKPASELENPEEVQKPFDSASNERALQLISGAIFKTKVDLTHPLMYGFSNKSLPVFRNHTTFLNPSKNPFSNPSIYDPDSPLMAGYCSDENIEKAKGTASVVVHPVGRGRIILLSDDPTFRGFWHATGRVLMNAIYFGDLTRP